jgi:hypothetical protein
MKPIPGKLSVEVEKTDNSLTGKAKLCVPGSVPDEKHLVWKYGMLNAGSLQPNTLR